MLMTSNGRFKRTVVCILLLSTAFATSISLAADRTLSGGNGLEGEMHRMQWSIPEFMISLWGGPNDEARARQLVEAGFNTVMGGGGFSTMQGREYLDFCHHFGLRVILEASLDEVADVRDHPALWGYYILDEPVQNRIPYVDLAPRVEDLRRLDPHHPSYINLNNHDNLIDYLRIVQPDVISYDRYQWWFGTNDYFVAQEWFRSASLVRQAPLICWVEAVASEDRKAPPDNMAKIRQSTYCSMAYGAKGIQWWAWDAQQEDAAAINRELASLGPVLMRLQSVGVYHTPFFPWGTWRIPEECWAQCPEQEVCLGFFRNEAGRNFLMVVNRSWGLERNIRLAFDETIREIERMDKANSEWIEEKPVKGKDGTTTLTLRMARGDGELLRFSR